MTFSLDDLQAIARDVIEDDEIELKDDQLPADIPGWDSLRHTLIVLEINASVGCDLSGSETHALGDFGELVRYVNERSKGR